MPAYLVGPRYAHHAGPSGYENFGSYCAEVLDLSVKERFLSHRLGTFPFIGDLGWRFDQLITALTPRPLYGLGILRIELEAGLHMMTNPGSLYHVLYGDTDLWLLNTFRQFSSAVLVATFHEPAESLSWLKIQDVARKLDAAIIVSESQRSFFKDLLPDERIINIPHGINTEFFRPAPDLSENPIVITVGSHLRDFDTFSEAIDRVLEINPQVRFKAVGVKRKGGGNMQLNHPSVEYLDGISDGELLAAYRSAGLAVFSLYEATANNALLEAMACGLPVVATDIGGTRQYLGDDPAALAGCRDGQELADRILAVLSDRPLALRLGRANRSRAEAFDYREVGAATALVYERVAVMSGSGNIRAKR